MKVAIPVTNGMVDGPGEGLKVRIYEVDKEVKLLEEYDNPALTAMAARGIYMLRSALDKGVTAFIVAEIGPPGVRFLEGKAKIYLAEGKVEDVLNKLIKGELKETHEPTHGEHHSHGHH
ncbi:MULTISPECIES: NifB/NifX family molybdenum-iron cluster-binding protein [Metallosphaera]|uniref:NifB/NifX family molybdenum-iron cluster-binding protein n=1 Tax=Metallosphaera TaxID=41980 RepID=UPI001F05F862|nr:NifB/NifX family molybdenum-iron cluster-binding protein [Metallosphaera sedula]MCH1770249.1 diguanylate cyclase [Metallosphaera sedula]MCP6727917.1 diguanylate cyclase [Metallosphaera sedula]BBL47482.1 diguanylate cyclase [Metallosphaera sedula]